jgi:hypothetical protein
MTDKPTDESKVELARAIVAKYGDDPIDDEFNSSGITEIEARLLEAFGPLEMARIITAAMHQASDTGDDDALVREAFQEALKRYPDAHGALTFFWTAAGFAAVPPTSEQMTWAKGCADRLQAKAHEGGPNG